jgi:hypothetical protein
MQIACAVRESRAYESRLVVQNLIPQRCHGKGRLTSRYANQGKAECQD